MKLNVKEVGGVRGERVKGCKDERDGEERRGVLAEHSPRERRAE